MRLYRSPFHDPYRNLAIEQALFRQGDEAVYLWVNRPCVVIGRNQNPYQEADLPLMREQGIVLLRRCSGGGAVYHDLGNLNFTYITDRPEPETIISLVQNCLRRFGIKAEKNGRNDLVVAERKISGMASCFDGACLYHGTLMVNVSVDTMARVLRPSPLKLQAKGIRSLRSRVLNLKEMAPGLTVEQLADTFSELLGLPETPIPNTPEVTELESALQRDEWLYGESPGYALSLERLWRGELYRFAVQVEQGRIRDVVIYTDALETEHLPELRNWMVGKPFLVREFDELLRQFPGKTSSP